MKTSQCLSQAILVTLGLATSAAAFASPPKWAHAHGRGHDHGNRDTDYARVVDVDPIIRRVRISTPQRECWTEERPVASGPSRTQVHATLAGGIIGAVVGHQIGHPHHDAAGVIGGSMLGAAIGSSIGASQAEKRGEYRQVAYESVQQCAVTQREEWAEQVDGYRVTYVYNGREYATRMPYDPGERIRVGVDVRPDFDRR